MNDTATQIAIVPKNTREEVRVSLDEFHGHHLVDVRTYATFDDGDAERRPTKKGVSLKVERLPDLIEALRDAEAEARRRGLLA